MSPEVVLLTTTEAAEMLRVEAATVRRWAADGKIPAVTLPSGQYRFYRSEIQAILASGLPSGTAA